MYIPPATSMTGVRDEASDSDDIEHLLFTMNGRQKNKTNRTMYNLTTT